MTVHSLTRRDFSVRLAAALSAIGLPLSIARAATSAQGTGDGISRNAESIHQEVPFRATPGRIYEALLDAKRFSHATGGMPAEINREAGGAFSLFGGLIKGRNIALVPNTRIVQAWRAGSWTDTGIYSIARFELKAQGAGTLLVFDHTGFPKGEAEHLAAGWKSNYWDNLQKALA